MHFTQVTINVVYFKKSSPKGSIGDPAFQTNSGFPLRNAAGMTGLEKTPLRGVATAYLSKVHNQVNKNKNVKTTPTLFVHTKPQRHEEKISASFRFT